MLIVQKRSRYIDASQKVSIETPVAFTEEYIEERRGEITVEIPRMYELLNIVTALYHMDTEYTSLIRRDTPYYEDVTAYFSDNRDHPAVALIGEAYQQMGYAHLRKVFIYGIRDDTLTGGTPYQSESLSGTYDPYAEMLGDFARASGFEAFYTDHIHFYAEQIELFTEYAGIRGIWDWLEARFPIAHDAYKVILSPLTGGSHNTFNFMDRSHDFSEIVMFESTPGIFMTGDLTDAQIRALTQRILFTEVDHNYVNPVTNMDRHIMDVAGVFSDIARWNAQSGYARPALTFNEYMTWSVYLLYARETYDADTYAFVEESTVNTMNYRGFIHFEDFYMKLAQLYDEQEDGRIDLLYPDVLSWAQGYRP